MPEMQKILGSDIEAHDIWVPEGADKKWRQESTREVVAGIIELQEEYLFTGCYIR